MRALRVIAVAVLLASAACGGGPDDRSLRDSFAAQLSANRFVTDFKRNGDELTFSAPRADGAKAAWRVHIDSAVVAANRSEAQPYKGTVKSSWFSDGQAVKPVGGESNLPLELMANGLSQDCWAFWDKAAGRWDWE